MFVPPPGLPSVLDPPPVSNCVVTLSISDQTTGIGAGQFTISGNQNGDQTTVQQGTQYTFRCSQMLVAEKDLTLKSLRIMAKKTTGITFTVKIIDASNDFRRF